MSKPPVVRFTSSVLGPHERGVEFGARFRDEIGRTVSAYRRLFDAYAGTAFDVGPWADRAWQAIRRLTPEYADEIAGIAAGAGRDPLELATINARTEILAAAWPPHASECSTVVCLPEDGPPVAVQTWDWYDAMSDGWLEWTIPHEDGRVVHTVTEYGMLAKIGVNGAGLGVMLNMLHHEADATIVAEGAIGYPVHLLSRTLLDRAESLKDALAITADARTSASTSLTVVDRESHAATIELFPGGPGVLEPTDGVLVRTNHFVSERGAPGCLAATVSNSSAVRRDHLLATLTEPASSAEPILAAMTHHHPEVGVCRHTDTRLEPALRSSTLATVVIDPEHASLDVSRGGPCAG